MGVPLDDGCSRGSLHTGNHDFGLLLQWLGYSGVGNLDLNTGLWTKLQDGQVAKTVVD